VTGRGAKWITTDRSFANHQNLNHLHRQCTQKVKIEMDLAICLATLTIEFAYPVVLFVKCLRTHTPSFLPVLVHYFGLLAIVNHTMFKGTDTSSLQIAERVVFYVTLQWITLDWLGTPFGLARQSVTLPSCEWPGEAALKRTYDDLWNSLPRPDEDSGPSD
jgi:hypothetical protein